MARCQTWNVGCKTRTGAQLTLFTVANVLAGHGYQVHADIMDAFASNDFKCTWEWCAKLDVQWDGTQYAFDHAQIPEWFDCTEYQRNAEDDVDVYAVRVHFTSIPARWKDEFL